MISEMIDVTMDGIKLDENSREIKIEEHDLNLNIKQEAPDETSSEVEVEENDLNLNIKQEVPDETGSEIKVEEHGVHLTLKREEECSRFDKYSSSTPANCTTTLLESELQTENICDLREETEEVNEIDSDWEVEDTKAKKGRLKCDKCVYQTDSPWNLRRHAYSHDDEKLVNCPYCSYKGKQKTHLLLHLKHSHPDKLPHACDFCSYRSLDLSCLEKHREKHKRDTMKCEFCNDFVTTDSVQMRSHKRQNHMQKCPRCKYRSLYTDRLKQHMLMHETEKILSCTNCRYKTELQYNLDRHIRRKHTIGNADYKTYNCPDCPFKTNHPVTYKSHCYRHTGEQPYPCDQCDYKALEKRNLEIHILYRHTNEKPFKCEVCQKGYAVQYDLQVHLAVHLKKKPFCCEECNFSSIYKSCLKSHKRIKHSKTLVCNVCNYKAECESDIKEHVKEHVLNRHIACKHTSTNVDYKMYNCLDCPFNINHSITYKPYSYLHSGERPFPCHECDYRARLKRHLKIHILYKHSNKKPFKCEVCQKAYPVQSDLQVHLGMHSKKKPFRCDECNFSTIYKSSLKTHKQLKRCKSLACQICSYKARCVSDIKRHMKEHS